MAVKLKRLNQQVMVITGASSGIGLVTARAAAERGTRLVLASRSQGELQQLKEEITANGGQAIAVGADVGQEEDVRRIAQAAQEQFGGFDTWVNNATYRSMASCWRFPSKTCDVCSKPTSGASCTALWKLPET
jgi:NADP-dependent 3-hydroxy acid dehydrogenase YdfG